MFQSAIKAEMLYNEGKINEAIDYLEKYVTSKRKINDELIQAHEYLLRYKKEIEADFSQHISFLLECDTEDIFADTIFTLGYELRKQGCDEQALRHFRLFKERAADPEQHAELFGFSDEWQEVCGLLTDDVSTEFSQDIYEKCNYGENIEVLTEKEKEYILCDSFVSEVNSGGLESYFSMDYSKYCVETVDYLEKNNSKIYPKVLREAISLFPKDFDFSDPMKTEDYLDEHEKILDKFDKLDSKIYKSTEDIDLILEQLKEQIK